MIDRHLAQFPGNYLFSEVARRVEKQRRSHPGARLIHMGVGDVTLPLPEAAAEAMAQAARELAWEGGFHGYGPEGGYDFLRQAIAGDYARRGVPVGPEEIFLSDGAKSDCAGLGALLKPGARLAVFDPVYPAYVGAAALAGRAGEYCAEEGRWSRVTYLPCGPENGFSPAPKGCRADYIYLCSPNNPTGTALGARALKAWVDWANRGRRLILFDGAYCDYLTGGGAPWSIYEVDGARTCAIELRSFSKGGGFTGVRCAYAVIPAELKRDGYPLMELWQRRQAICYNGVSYVTQRGAEALFTPEGREQVQSRVAFYLRNAGRLREGLEELGLEVYGGRDSPYVWVRLPGDLGSWAGFDLLLTRAGVICTPGVGFGPMGEGFVRLTGFASAADIQQALERLAAIW